MKKTVIFIFSLLFLMVVPLGILLAQPPPPPPKPIPLDVGLLTLIIGGLALFVKKIFSSKKEK